MADELIEPAEVISRLDWELDALELSLLDGAIEDLSEDARHYGLTSWTSENAPRQVKSLVRRAAKRYMTNHDGYNTSRAGDETVGWSDKAPQVASGGTAEFTPKERDMLREIAGNVNSGFYSTEIAGWGDPERPIGRKGTYYVPDPDGGKPFPLYAHEGPW